MMEEEGMHPEEITPEMVFKTFLAEAEEHLSGMEETLIALETEPENDELLHALFRTAHTLKGNAGTVGFTRVAESAHAVEDLLQRLRSRTVSIDALLISRLLQAIDLLRRIVSQEAAGEAIPPATLEFFDRLSSAAEGGEAASVSPPAEERRKIEKGRREEDRPSWNDRTRTLRIDIERLDRLLNLTGEVAIAQGRLGQLLERANGKEEIREAHRETSRLFVDLQEQVMKIRMVPIGPIFRQHLRTVRDAARDHGKIARLVIEGGEVEVDTAVIENLKDPLLHMIRNAVDHGIESPDRREAAGKNPCGRMILRAFHDAGSIVLQIEDDGAGFDRRRIVEKALSKGMIPNGEGLSDEEILELVFEPGFSTAESVTDLSGRGVGMDVVRRNIEALRGSVSIESRDGAGTKITLRLPLTLAIIDGFAVGVGDETYILPLDAVVECLELKEEERVAGCCGILHLRGKALPYVRLRHLFQLSLPPPRRESVVVVGDGEGKAGITVDFLYGERQIVIKPLGKLFEGLPGVIGSTILGNGRVALIIDVPGLIALARQGAVQVAVGNG